LSKLVETLAGELERPRELSVRVLNYIGGTYGLDQDGIGDFLVSELPKLEDDEIDLILSPVFTPKLADQAIFAELLGRDSIPRDRWPGLIRELVARPTRAQLTTPDSRCHSVTLREVTVERYVHRLRLEGAISESLVSVLHQVPAVTDQPVLKAIARRAIWENKGTEQILARYLTTATDRGTYALDDVIELLNLVEGRKPADVDDLIARISGWQEALRQQIDVASGAKPFFNEDIRMLHGGGRDQRGQDDLRISTKRREFEFLGRLQQMFAG
jgi:hypothetical protein